ncbi:DUF7169 domain-containing protein [Streptomyces sennicomposti]
MIELLASLAQAASEIRQFVIAYGDAADMPGRTPDMDSGGRQAASGPSRPTERAALDERRLALLDELKSGAAQLPYAVAVLRGVSASMDRALSRWEGEDVSIHLPGGSLDHCNGAAQH